jgi:hypothetical protein
MPRLSLDLEPGIVVLAGENGAGKTNLLEAISLLSPGGGCAAPPTRRSRVRARPTGSPSMRGFDGPFGECEIGTGTMGNGAGLGEGGRKVRINGGPRARPMRCWNGCAWSGWCPPWTSSFPGRPATAAAFSTGWCWRSIPVMAVARSTTKRPCAAATGCSPSTAPIRPGSMPSRRRWPRPALPSRRRGANWCGSCRR